MISNLPLIITFALFVIGAVTGDETWSIAGIAFGAGAGAGLFTAAYMISRKRR